MESVPRILLIGSVVLFIAGCAATPLRDRSSIQYGPPQIAPFSAQQAGANLPGAWRPWVVSGFKRRTQYDLVDHAGRTVVAAQADTAASGLMHPVRFDPKEFPILSWRWKTNALIDGANNQRAATEDSPLRIVVAFEGDVSKLKPMDQLAFRKFKMFAKADLPYATLMYIWENRAPTGMVINNSHTSRIKMIVADSGTSQLGDWCERGVNLYEDFRNAFGEDPPPVIWIGVMTDTDNTGERIKAYYGDIQVRAAAR